MRVALGLKARTGRAVLVAIGVDESQHRVLERSEFKLLPAGAFAPYHAAEGLEPAEAREAVARSIQAAHELAAKGIREAVERLGNVGGCTVLVGPGMPEWTTEDILAVHVRMHQAEGELFRSVLVAGARACNLALSTLREKAALDEAASILGVTRSRLDSRLAALGKSAGPPWGKDQKEAAAAALVALK